MRTDRRFDELRPVTITRGYTEMTPGSVLITMGSTRVLCTVSFDFDVPPWMRQRNEGWVTAEYAMLPGSGKERISRGSIRGGRVKEIQRLIGRSLRAAVDLSAMPGVTALVDCDVLQADGGTRTASITGAWVALADAFDVLVGEGRLAAPPLVGHVAAVSVGALGEDALLDLDYVEDVSVDVDCNVVMTGSGNIVEIQGTAEGDPFTQEQFDQIMGLARKGVEELVALQKLTVS